MAEYLRYPYRYEIDHRRRKIMVTLTQEFVCLRLGRPNGSAKVRFVRGTITENLEIWRKEKHTVRKRTNNDGAAHTATTRVVAGLMGVGHGTIIILSNSIYRRVSVARIGGEDATWARDLRPKRSSRFLSRCCQRRHARTFVITPVSIVPIFITSRGKYSYPRFSDMDGVLVRIIL